jgi:crotonobetainyl-CoA:carnitine CoA-transferase CaiB-like acyl-CoA transferase
MRAVKMLAVCDSGGEDHPHRRPCERGDNILDGGAPYHDTYETSGCFFLAVGAIEAKFFPELAQRIGLDEEDMPNRAHWPALRAKMVTIFRTQRVRNGAECWKAQIPASRPS